MLSRDLSKLQWVTTKLEELDVVLFQRSDQMVPT